MTLLHGQRRSRGDSGSTLVELLVVMCLTTIILAAVGTVFTSATRSVRETQVRTYAQADARNAAETMSRSLRVAVVPPGGSTSGAFASATPTSVSFYANLQRTPVTLATSGPSSAPVVRAGLQLPSLVTYSYDDTTQCLTETVTPGAVNTTASASTTPVLWATPGSPKCLAKTTSAPAFSYFTSSVIAASNPAVDLPSGTALTDPVARTVVSVGFDVAVTAPTAPDVPATHIADRVTLVNVLPSQAG